MDNRTIVVSGAPPAMFLLFLTFLILKLIGVITWSWFFITMPIWGGLALIISIILLCFSIWLLGKIIADLVELFYDAYKYWKQNKKDRKRKL